MAVWACMAVWARCSCCACCAGCASARLQSPALHETCPCRAPPACSVHSPTPRVFALFDQLLMLEKGCAIYFGPAGGCWDGLCLLCAAWVRWRYPRPGPRPALEDCCSLSRVPGSEPPGSTMQAGGAVAHATSIQPCLPPPARPPPQTTTPPLHGWQFLSLSMCPPPLCVPIATVRAHRRCAGLAPVHYFSQLCPSRPGLAPGENAADWIVDITCKASAWWALPRWDAGAGSAQAACQDFTLPVRVCVRTHLRRCRCRRGAAVLQAEWRGDEDAFAASYADSDLKRMADAEIQLLLSRSNSVVGEPGGGGVLHCTALVVALLWRVYAPVPFAPGLRLGHRRVTAAIARYGHPAVA